MRDSSPPRPAGPAAAGPASCGRPDGTHPTSGRRRSALRHASHINKRAEGAQVLLWGAPFERFRPLGWSHSRRSAARPARPRPIRWLQPPAVAHRGGSARGIQGPALCRQMGMFPAHPVAGLGRGRPVGAYHGTNTCLIRGVHAVDDLPGRLVHPRRPPRRPEKCGAKPACPLLSLEPTTTAGQRIGKTD